MSNPFDSESGQFLVLKNVEGQYSLWPQFTLVPSGWEIAFGPEARNACTEYVDLHWVDMRPMSLVSAAL